MPLAEDTDGQCGARSARAPRRLHPRHVEARSRADLHEGRCRLRLGSRWKQRYFTRRGDDYFPLPAQWDITHARWLPYHVPKNADWWAPALPRRQYAASDRPAVRWLPLGQLRHQDQERHRVERRLRGMPRGWQRSCRPPDTTNDRESRNTRFCPRQRHVHPCHTQGRPITNPIAGKYYDWPVGFLARKRASAGYWGLEAAQARGTQLLPFPRRDRATTCRATTSSRASCITRSRDLLLMP